MPGMGGIPGLGHIHIGNGNLGGAVSGSPLTILTPRMVIGNKQLQQTSVIGLTNLPVQPTFALAELQVKHNNMININGLENGIINCFITSPL